MKHSKVIKEAQARLEDMLQKISAGNVVEVTIVKTDAAAHAQGWPSAAIMKMSVEQLHEALPDSLRKYLKIINIS